MSKVRTVRERAQAAAQAHTDLTIFHTIIQILEGGCLYGATAQADSPSHASEAVLSAARDRTAHVRPASS